MPRDIPVGNGILLVTFDRMYQIRDFYFPHPGRENQSEGRPFRFGVWADGLFSWVSADDWTRECSYLKETLVTYVRLRSERLGLEVVSNDAVDFHCNVFLRRLRVRDLTNKPREVRIFFHHDFRISESEIGDTAYFDPTTDALVHYKRNRYFLITCQTQGRDGFDQWATGNKDFNQAEGTWRDAEDGSLQGNSVAQGSVDSTLSIRLSLEAQGQQTLFYWIVAGKSHHEVRIVNDIVRKKTPEVLLRRTRDYWQAWVNKEAMNFGDMPENLIDAFKRSLLIIRSNLDDNGAILAANDGDVESFNRDTYSYMWPRDGALTAYALDIAGFSELTRRFYSFAKDLINRAGFFLHKYTPDGTPGSSWHPWIKGGERQLPIQEDETALILWGLWKHYNEHLDIEFITDFYRPVIVRAANFMVSYRDEDTGLPHPSWDLWEERRGVHTFTVATVWAGLQAAARFANLFGERDLVEKYIRAADEIKQGLITHLYRPELGRFARMMKPQMAKGLPDSHPEYDTTIDASLFGVWYFGVLDAADPMVEATMKAIEERLWVKTAVGGLARYENDTYHQVSNDIENVPGNPWFICTLWLAQYRIARARSSEELKEALSLIEWVTSHALDSGVLAEQVNPYTDAPLSVSPLTWSHAQMVTAVMEYLEKLRELNLCQSCGQPAFSYERRNPGTMPARMEEFRLRK
jgi:oligosaccharide amylase